MFALKGKIEKGTDVILKNMTSKIDESLGKYTI